MPKTEGHKNRIPPSPIIRALRARWRKKAIAKYSLVSFIDILVYKYDVIQIVKSIEKFKEIWYEFLNFHL